MRPLPPTNHNKSFISSLDLECFVRSTFLNDKNTLCNPEHSHLIDAKIGYLWAFEPNSRGGKQIIGEAERLNPKGGKWQIARQKQQIKEFFPNFISDYGFSIDFIITLDANFCLNADDASFCALLEHELYHCTYQIDEFGMPKFNKEGKMSYSLKGHDVEEFTGVVRRYGLGALSPEVSEFVAAANRSPEIGQALMNAGCGTCLRLA